MNIFTRRRNGPLPLMRERPVSEQATKRRKENAEADKAWRQLDAEIERIAKLYK